jgi:hypothetical protein
VRAAATAGRAAQPVAFAHPSLANPNAPDYHADHPDHPDRDADHPDHSDHDANTNGNHDEPVAASKGNRHHGYLHPGPDPLGYDFGQGDHGADAHAEIESRRHANEDDDEGTSQQHPDAPPIPAGHSNPGHR